MFYIIFLSLSLLFSAGCPTNLDTANTLSSYDKGAVRYNEFTKQLEMHPLQDKFLKEIKNSFSDNHCKILSVGAGPCNRDEIYFLQQGFKMLAYDGSPKMVEIAKSNIEPFGGVVELSDFMNFTTTEKFEGIWALASLHHIPMKDLSAVLVKHGQFLKTGGIFFMSLLGGEGEAFSEVGPGAGKFWSKYTVESVRKILNEHLKNFEILELKEVETKNQGFSILWVNVLLKKTK